MIATLAWKEYKEQRAIWLAIALLAVVLSLMIAMMARGGMEEAHNDIFILETIGFLLIAMVAAQGVVSGAQLFAGEKDAGNAMFLDTLSSRRYPLWQTKFMIGASLTLMQAIVLFSIAWFLQMGNWDILLSLALIGWLALLWGMVGGAICEHVFPAILLGIALVVGNIILFFLVPIFPGLIIAALSGVPLALSNRIYCAADTDRVLKDKTLQTEPPQSPFGWRVLLWLSEKQGSWIVWPGLAVSFVAGFVLWHYEDFMWPIVTMIIGLVCGMVTFTPEQSSEQDRFLGAQRFPPGRVWLVKTLFWALAAAGMVGLCYLGMYYRQDMERRTFPSFMGIFFPDRNLKLFLVEWVVFGFCCGQFSSLLSRKIVVSMGLAIIITLFLLAWWVPSLLFGGIRAEQILIVPILLLITARFVMWPWFSGRLYTRPHILLLLGCALLVCLWTGANLWHRAVEIPDVGQPFDVQAFEKQLDKAAQSPANFMIRHGLENLDVQLNTVDEKIGLPTKPLFSPEVQNLLDARNLGEKSYLSGNYLLGCREILELGWPSQDEEINRWLDAVFAGEWARDFQAASTMPLGLLVDPRTFERRPSKNPPDFSNVGYVQAVRALQLLKREEYQKSLDELAVMLGLSRQLRHFVPSASFANGLSTTVDWSSLRGFDFFVDKVGPRPELLRKALDLLQKQEEESADPTGSIMADYIVTRNILAGSVEYWNNFKPVTTLLFDWALKTPWEGERQLRFINALYQGDLRAAQNGRWSSGRYRFLSDGLTLTDCNWTVAQWDQLIKMMPHTVQWGFQYRSTTDNFHLHYLHDLRLRQVLIALTLYQIEQGHAAAKLDDLAPRYLAKLPLDPFRGTDTVGNAPFNYKVSKEGEFVYGSIFTPHGTGTIKTEVQLLPGQGVLWFMLSDTENTWYPIPMGKKK